MNVARTETAIITYILRGVLSTRLCFAWWRPVRYLFRVLTSSRINSSDEEDEMLAFVTIFIWESAFW